ncbi:hypothetical protein Csa_010911 [Cucumis sativus]|uniref:Uncharacterized protein n=1 Tax=Cucumis sativus TaxID=3659 RepID=A0A0A0L710_CUCSA|nr:hypothetical protein Csa_010911 [Cucumis sativus]
MKEISIKSPTNFSRADVGNGIAKNGLISNFTVRLGCEISLNLCRFASFYQAMDQDSEKRTGKNTNPSIRKRLGTGNFLRKRPFAAEGEAFRF